MSTSERFDTLLDADTLRANLGNPDWRVIDCRHDLAQPQAGAQAYAAGHVAGAVFAHLDRDLSGAKTPQSGRHPLPDPDRLAGCFRRWGIEPHTQIVAYDASAGSYAARLWWLARWLGHERVAILDGGWPAILGAGLTIETAEPRIAPGRFERGAPLVRWVDVDAIQSARADPSRLIIDARAPDRYAGRNETIDPVAGHIPGAANRFWQANIGPDGRFKPADQLRSEFTALLAARPPGDVISQCGSGVTACHNLLAMQRAGLAGAALYPGSWSQWIADPARPVAVGSDPGGA
jgi:thiosulfate/3-mercaptopyruvate sulfurtransferase